MTLMWEAVDPLSGRPHESKLIIAGQALRFIVLLFGLLRYEYFYDSST